MQKLNYAQYRAATGETEACLNCSRFCRHYIGDGTALYFGHCMRGRFRLRNVLECCEHFEPAEQIRRGIREAVISREQEKGRDNR